MFMISVGGLIYWGKTCYVHDKPSLKHLYLLDALLYITFFISSMPYYTSPSAEHISAEDLFDAGAFEGIAEEC
jgi:hypothetical protein